MLGIVQTFFGSKANPIGVDFGTDSVRLAQVQRDGGEVRLVAAASADVPTHVQNDPPGRMRFFTTAVRELLRDNPFVGRHAVLSLPAAGMFVQHLRMAKMSEADRAKAIPWEIRGKLPFDPSKAVLRNHVAGEVYQEQEAKDEVIVMAARREMVEQYLAAAEKAKLDVAGMEIESAAMLSGFSYVYRRADDAKLTVCFIDIGAAATRAVVARGGHMLFARVIPVGGQHLTAAVAEGFGIQGQEARLLRMRVAMTETEPMQQPSVENSFAMLNADRRKEGESDPHLAVRTEMVIGTDGEAARVEEAVRRPLSKLVKELDLCRRYHDATFPSVPIDRLIFVGGEAHNRQVCQQIAKELSVAAQIGDPMVRMERAEESELTGPQPSWAVAVGLSLGAGVLEGVEV